MSKAPARARFQGPWNDREAAKLTTFVDSVVDALSGQLSVADNLAGGWLDVEFDGPAASLSIASGLDAAPKAVLLGRLLNVTTGDAYGVAFSWSFSDGNVNTTSFSGLGAGSYRATLLVLKE